jgi:4-hydroxy-tetrahydrodipicolinate reductase
VAKKPRSKGAVLSVGVGGACGKMGERILALLRGEAGMRPAAAVERAGHPGLGQDVGEALGGPACGVKLEASLRAPVDVFIEFSTPDGTAKRLAECVRLGVPILVGTTAMPASLRESLRAASSRIPVCVASNVSIGANLLFRLAEEAARVLGDRYDVEIVEAHHRMKKDAPSGTALTLAQRVAESLGRDLEEVRRDGRRGDVGARAPAEIGIHAVRGGDVVGEHTIWFAGLGERIEISHKASTRDTFARGAVRAAAWLARAGKGWYGIEEALGLK